MKMEQIMNFHLSTLVDNEDGTNNELSLSQDISMKSTEKNTNDDTLDIPAFLRRQRE